MGFGRHVGGGEDVLCGLIFFGWKGRVRDVCVSARGERWGKVFMGSVSLPASQDKESLVKSSKSPDAEICEKRAHIVLILPTSLPQGTDGCEALCAQL